jgi:hypothetical protein
MTYEDNNMIGNKLCKSGLGALAVAAAIGFAPSASAVLATYSQDWEGFSSTYNTDTSAISGDGFVIGNINVTTGGQWFAGAPAPNYAAIPGVSPGWSALVGVSPGWSALVNGEGGAEQGDIQLSIFPDYTASSPWNTDSSWVIQTFVYKDMGTIEASDVGKTYSFSFDAKLSAISVTSSAWAYINVLKQSDNSFDELFNGRFDSGTELTGDWSGGSVEVLIDAGMVGELLQIGFATEAVNYGDAAIFYDNIGFDEAAVVPVPAAVWLFGSGLIGLVGVARRRKAQS